MPEGLGHSHKPESRPDGSHEALNSHKSPELRSEAEHKYAASRKHHELESDRQSAVEELSRSAESLSLASKETALHDIEASTYKNEPSTSYVNKELRTMALQRTMLRVRKQLNPADRLLSKAIHNPAVEKLSEVGSKTVGRPSGLLGGGLAAAIGTTVYYYAARHYGYEYNFSVFLVLVAAGFIAGLAVEFISKLFRNKSAS